MLKSSELYARAVERAKASNKVAEALGGPVEPGWWISGSIETSGPSGSADLAIPLRSPNNRGTLYVVAGKEAGLWQFKRLEVEVDGRAERIDLLQVGGGTASGDLR